MKHVIGRRTWNPEVPPRMCLKGTSAEQPVSLHLTEGIVPGQGPRLHRHPYEEVFVVHEGQATYSHHRSGS